VHLGPGPSGLTHAIAGRPDAESRIITGRLNSLRANMQRVVEAISERALNDAP
jgi:hypothetical protein